MHAKQNSMKKKTVVITIIIVLVIVGLVGTYTFLSRRAYSSVDNTKLSQVQLVLSYDLQSNYPASVRKVIEFYIDIQKCFYNEEYTDEELEALGMKARELYDDELLEANEISSYMQRLSADIGSFKVNNRRMTNAAPGSSTSVFYFEEDGYKFARIRCGYTITENYTNKTVPIVYVLRQDSKKRWKIYGWQNDTGVNAAN